MQEHLSHRFKPANLLSDFRRACEVAPDRLPFLVLQPAMGAGVAARKTPRPWISRGRSAAAHLAFGAGVFLGARLLPWTH